MSWTIERRDRVAVVTMTTDLVSAQNRAFFADPQAPSPPASPARCRSSSARPAVDLI